jgi:Ca2+/Na+ antiporter
MYTTVFIGDAYQRSPIYVLEIGLSAVLRTDADCGAQRANEHAEMLQTLLIAATLEVVSKIFATALNDVKQTIDLVDVLLGVVGFLKGNSLEERELILNDLRNE